jgi:hypothetical protein
MFRGNLLRLGAIVYLLPAIVIRLNAQLSQAGIVSGSVITRDGSQLPQATITVSAPDGFRRVTSATADGTFSIVDLPSGTYLVQASAPSPLLGRPRQ